MNIVYNEKIGSFENYIPVYADNLQNVINCQPLNTVCAFSAENVNVVNGNVKRIGELVELVEDSTSHTIKMDPFSAECRIPLPSLIPPACLETANFIRRRNERERVRVRNVNKAFERLRSHLPLPRSQLDKRLSKVEILRRTIEYIKYLEHVLEE